jgi:uncharacterized protein
MPALVDAGPLISVLTQEEQDHKVFARLLSEEPGPLISTAPCLTEAMHFASRELGWLGKQALFDLLDRSGIELRSGIEHIKRMRELMEKYRDIPMDFADASLVTLAEQSGIWRIMTTDYSGFYAFKFARNRSFEILGPPPSWDG